MLYQFAKFLAVRAVNLFYSRVVTKNIENVPVKGPVIFTANHPNTMSDPMLIGYASNRILHFIGKSTLFSGRFFSWLLSHLNIIPVYRKQDTPGEMDKNRDTFERCYQLLERGGTVLIFPEGISSAERTLHKIKTGSARIGFGAEVRNNFQLGVKIIPVGINYSELGKFRSEAYVRFGQPIDLSEYTTSYAEDEVETVHLVTQRIETALKKLTVTVIELDLEDIVSGLEKIYKKELITDLGLESKDRNDDFAVTRGMIQAVEWFYEQQPERVENFKKLLHKYLANLQRLNLDDDFLSPRGKRDAIFRRAWAVIFLTLGFPFYFYGLVNNFLPYQFPRWFARRYVKNIEWHVTAKIASGAIIFLVYYGSLVTVVANLVSNIWIILAYIVSLIPSGNFVLFYLRRFQRYRQHLHFMNVFYNKRDLIYQVIEQRLQLIHFIDEAKQEYLSHSPELV